MVRSDDGEIAVFSGLLSFIYIPFLLFMSIVSEIPLMMGIMVLFISVWVTFVVKSNKDYKLMKLQELVIESDEETLTKPE